MKKPIFAFLLAFSLLCTMGASSIAAVGKTGFSDVAADAWYADAVNWAAATGIINGYSDGRFAPGDGVTRAQLAVILWRMQGSPTVDGGTASAPGEPDMPDAPAETGKALVAYFSHSGSTRGVAEAVAECTGGPLFELEPQNAYPSDYSAVLAQAQRELNQDARPALQSHVEDMEQYDVIFLGFPIWHGNTPMLIRTFLEEYDLSGKTIAPFSTSGSGGIGEAVSAIRTLCPDSNVVDGLAIPSGSLSRADSLAADWVDELNLSQSTTPLMPKLSLHVGNRTFPATLENNDATRALMSRLPMTVTMGELNGNEKYYYLPNGLPANSYQPGALRAGDLMLYGSDCMVLFYESFSSAYSYTRLGRVDDPAGLAAALGGDSVEVAFRVE